MHKTQGRNRSAQGPAMSATGCAGSWQWRGGEHTTSAVLGNSAAAVTVEPH